MTPIMLQGPAAEPVGLAEAKAYLRIDGDDEDELVGMLVTAARLTVEVECGRALIQQRWRLSLDRWPRGCEIRVPIAPFRACEAVRVHAGAGTPSLVPPDAYIADAAEEGGRILMTGTPPAPARRAGGIEADIVVGYGPRAGDVPGPLRQAVRLLVARWFERRGDDPLDEGPARLPGDVAALLAPYRRAGL